jgi:uncharacterized protein (AIM24 family)
MQVTIEKSPNAIAIFQLEPGETILAAPGRLLSQSSGVTLGACFGRGYPLGQRSLVAFWRSLLGFISAFFHKIVHGTDSFFHLYQASTVSRVVLTPSLPGEIMSLPLQGRPQYFHPESFLACTAGIELVRAPRAPLLCATGVGTLYLCGFGEIASIEVDGNYALDFERFVALEPSLSFQLQQKTLELFGKGRLWVHTGKISKMTSLRSSW